MNCQTQQLVEAMTAMMVMAMGVGVVRPVMLQIGKIELPETFDIPGITFLGDEFYFARTGVSKWDDREIDGLFRRLYSNIYKDPTRPEIPYTNPHVTPFISNKIEIMPHYRAGNYTYETALVQYIYWPALEIGYVADIHVSFPLRGRKLASKLLDYTIRDMRNNGIRNIYTYTISHEGYMTMLAKGFSPVFEEGKVEYTRWLKKRK